MSDDQLSKDIVQDFVERGVYQIVDSSSACYSDAWKTFGILVDKDFQEVEGFVGCKKCQKVLNYIKGRTGTSPLWKHQERCKKSSHVVQETVKVPVNFRRSSNQQEKDKMTYGFRETSKVSSITRRSSNQQEKDKMTQLAVEYVCRDVQSFESVSGEGFLQLAQGLIDVGARLGHVNVRELLPDTATLSSNATRLADAMRQSLISELRACLGRNGHGAVTLDMWTDDYSKVDYLCVTLHYIGGDWTLRNRVLRTSEWDNALRTTSDNLKPAIVQALRKFSLGDLFPKLTYVTDRGANIIAALRSVTRLNCTTHVLNAVLHHTLNKRDAEDDVCSQEIASLVDAAKSLVNYFEHSKLQSRLNKPLKAAVDARWDSVYAMLESISSQYKDVRRILEERDAEFRLTELPTDTLSSVVSFLHCFKKATLALEAPESPTLHLTAVWLDWLRRHLQPSAGDNQFMASLKSRCLSVLLDELQLHMLHKLAVFLHPKLKSLELLCNEEDANAVISEAGRLVQKIRLEHDEADIKPDPNELDDWKFSLPPPSKRFKPKPAKSRGAASDGDDLSDGEGVNHSRLPADEVQLYIDTSFPWTSPEEEFNLLNWWKVYAHRFPTLAKVARFVLSIPATSAPSERRFSVASFVLQERKTQLKPGTVDDVLFLHSNLPR